MCLEPSLGTWSVGARWVQAIYAEDLQDFGRNPNKRSVLNFLSPAIMVQSSSSVQHILIGAALSLNLQFPRLSRFHPIYLGASTLFHPVYNSSALSFFLQPSLFLIFSCSPQRIVSAIIPNTASLNLGTTRPMCVSSTKWSALRRSFAIR